MITATAVLLIALIVGVPVAFSIGLSAFAYFLIADANLLVLPQQFIGQLSNQSLIAIPFFILAGELMNCGGITTRSRSPAPYPGVPVGFRVGSPGSPRLTMGFPSPESTRSPRRPRYCVLIGTHGFRLSSPPPDGSCCSFSDPITALRVVTQTPT